LASSPGSRLRGPWGNQQDTGLENPKGGSGPPFVSPATTGGRIKSQYPEGSGAVLCTSTHFPAPRVLEPPTVGRNVGSFTSCGPGLLHNSTVIARPSVPLQWRHVSGEERWARGVQTSLGHRDGCFCGGRARRDHGPRSLRARGWAICRHSPRCRDRGGPRGNFGPTIGPVVGPPVYLAAPGVDRHHYFRGAGAFPEAHHTPGPSSGRLYAKMRGDISRKTGARCAKRGNNSWDVIADRGARWATSWGSPWSSC
jgi:hypothetical protein